MKNLLSLSFSLILVGLSAEARVCQFQNGRAIRTTNVSEVQACLVNTNLYCEKKFAVDGVKKGDMPSVRLNADLVNQGTYSNGKFSVTERDQVYRRANDKGLNVTLKTDRSGHIYLAYGKETSDDPVVLPLINKNIHTCYSVENGRLSDTNSCLRSYRATVAADPCELPPPTAGTGGHGPNTGGGKVSNGKGGHGNGGNGNGGNGDGNCSDGNGGNGSSGNGSSGNGSSGNGSSGNGSSGNGTSGNGTSGNG